MAKQVLYVRSGLIAAAGKVRKIYFSIRISNPKLVLFSRHYIICVDISQFWSTKGILIFQSKPIEMGIFLVRALQHQRIKCKYYYSQLLASDISKRRGKRSYSCRWLEMGEKNSPALTHVPLSKQTYVLQLARGAKGC